MLLTNHCLGYFFRYAWLSITLFVFAVTSIMPLHSAVSESISKGVIDNLNPAKKIEKLNDYAKKLESFTEKTSMKDLSSFMRSLKRFTEEEIAEKLL